MRFHMEDDSLAVIFEGAEQFWALKRRLVISKMDIAHAEWVEGELLPRHELGWRVGGTGLPGVLYAGRFAGSSGLNFVYLQHPMREAGGVKLHHVLTLELRDNRYKRLLLTIDKPDIAERIIAWWSNNV
jgi:hypothetical protein